MFQKDCVIGILIEFVLLEFPITIFVQRLYSIEFYGNEFLQWTDSVSFFSSGININQGNDCMPPYRILQVMCSLWKIKCKNTDVYAIFTAVNKPH